MEQFLTDAQDFLPILLQGCIITVQVTVGALVLSTALGFLWAVMRISSIAILRWTAIAIITVFRGVPIIVQLFYVYFVLPDLGIQLSAFEAAIVGLGVGYSAYQAENFRSGILAIDPGQSEAAQSIGMTRSLIMRRVILPQAIRVILPPYGNLMIMLLKDSSLASAITVAELTRGGQMIAASTFKNMTVYTLVALIYLFMSLPLASLASWLERKFGRK